MRRSTRLTNGSSEKVESHAAPARRAAVAGCVLDRLRSMENAITLLAARVLRMRCPHPATNATRSSWVPAATGSATTGAQAGLLRAGPAAGGAMLAVAAAVA